MTVVSTTIGGAIAGSPGHQRNAVQDERPLGLPAGVAQQAAVGHQPPVCRRVRGIRVHAAQLRQVAALEVLAGDLRRKTESEAAP